MKSVSRFIILCLVTLLACTDEEYRLHGTILKEVIVKQGNGEILSHLLYNYDNAGNLIEIKQQKPLIYPYPVNLNTNIEYHNGQVVKVNQDSLVYENGTLSKTFYLDEDTSYVRSEFQFEGGRMIGKNVYIRPNPFGQLGNSHEIIDTAFYEFVYDEAGNISKTLIETNQILIFNGSDINQVGNSGEFEYDSKTSPFVNLPLALKCVLNLNPGPNNIIKKTTDGLRGGDPLTLQWALEYNLDGYPVNSELVNSPLSSFNGYTLLKYY